MLMIQIYSCQRNVTNISEEIKNILQSTEENKLSVREHVIYRPNARNYLAAAELPGIERIICAKLLGV